MADDWGQFIDRVHGEDEPKPKGRRRPPPLPAGRKPKRPSPARKGPPRKGPPRKGPPSAAPRRAPTQAQPGTPPPAQNAAQRIRAEIDQKARIVPVEKIQQGGSKFVRVINPSTLSEIVGKAVIAVLEERSGEVAEQERAEIESQARKQFMELLGEHQRVLAEKSKSDAERAKLEEARQRALVEKEEATQQRAQIERERARALAEADKRRAELEQERIKALAEARARREELEQERVIAAQEREELQRERAEALEGKSQAEHQKTELSQQMEALRAEIEASRQALDAERELEETGDAPGKLLLSEESVADVEYRVQALLDRMLRDGELAAGAPAAHTGLEDFERELGQAVSRVLAAARKDAGGGRSEAIELLERRINKLNRALIDRQEAMEGLDSGQDLHPRFRTNPLEAIHTEEVSARSSALVGAGIELPESSLAGEPESETTKPEPVAGAPEAEPAAESPARPTYREAVYLSEPEDGLSRLVPVGSWPFLWRCGALRMVFLDNLTVQDLEPTEDEIAGPFPASSRLFDGGKVDGDNDPATWSWPLHST